MISQDGNGNLSWYPPLLASAVIYSNPFIDIWPCFAFAFRCIARMRQYDTHFMDLSQPYRSLMQANHKFREI